MATIHILHAHPAMNAGLYAILAFEPEWSIERMTAPNSAELTGAVCLADYATGLALARSRGRELAVIVVTQRDTEWDIRCALDAGVRGYILQSSTPEELIKATKQVVSGRSYVSASIAHQLAEGRERAELTGRESEVLQLLAEGHCNKVIARRLGIAVETVKSHVKHVMNKLGASARTHAVVIAAERGMVKAGRQHKQSLSANVEFQAG
jgi:DNA-binding NarL/FixJ family response regulator